MGIRVKNVKQDLAAGRNVQVTQSKDILETVPKAVYQTRQDIKKYKAAEALAQGTDPKNYALQILLKDIMKDALLTSQVENRIQQLFSMDIRLKKPDGEVDEQQTKDLVKHPIYRFLTRQAIESRFYEYSLAELEMVVNVEGELVLQGKAIPRPNVVPQTGMFYPDYTDSTKKIAYRDLPEYGTWILEFWNKEGGLLSKAVPHVLFKRFAQTCWSQLCEIYGIPPRVMKTNTNDKNMMARAQKMMRDMGAAAWFIIDEDESFEWAKAVDTNGDIYKNLIDLCRNELCLLIVGAIMGQDTKNGSRSKDESAQETLWLLVQSDMALLEEAWNNTIIPALKKHGVITGDVTFEFVPTEDIDQLFDMVMQSLEYFDIDADWFKEKFGIEVTGKKETPQPSKDKEQSKLKADLLAGADDFFGTPRRRRG